MALKRIQKRIKNPLIFGFAGAYALLGAIIGTGLIPIPFLGTWLGAWLGAGLSIFGGLLGALVGRQIAKFINAGINLWSNYKLDRSLTTLSFGSGSVAIVSTLMLAGTISLPITAPLVSGLLASALILTALAIPTLLLQQAFRAYAYFTMGYTHPEKYILSNDEKEPLQRKLQLSPEQITAIHSYLVDKIHKHKTIGKTAKEDVYKEVLLAFKIADGIALKKFVSAEVAKKSFNASPEKNLDHTNYNICKRIPPDSTQNYLKEQQAKQPKWISAITAKKRLLTTFSPFLKDDVAAVFEQKDVLAEAKTSQPKALQT